MEGLSPIYSWLNPPSAHAFDDFTQIPDWNQDLSQLPMYTIHEETGGYNQTQLGHVPSGVEQYDHQQFAFHGDPGYGHLQLPDADGQVRTGATPDHSRDVTNRVSDWLSKSQPGAVASSFSQENMIGRESSTEVARFQSELSRYVVSAAFLDACSHV